MGSVEYALVAYVTSPVGRFVEELRQELEPDQPLLPAHLTVLPPRPLEGPEEKAVEVVEQVCAPVQPFEITLGDVETFVPITPTVFLRVARAAYRMRELHDRLNTGILRFDESWPYMPHLTITKSHTAEGARDGYELARQRWAEYRGARNIRIAELTFVRGTADEGWKNLAPIPLGRSLAGVSR